MCTVQYVGSGPCMLSIRPTSFAVSNTLQREAEAPISPLDTSNLNAGANSNVPVQSLEDNGISATNKQTQVDHEIVRNTLIGCTLDVWLETGLFSGSASINHFKIRRCKRSFRKMLIELSNSFRYCWKVGVVGTASPGIWTARAGKRTSCCLWGQGP